MSYQKASGFATNLFIGGLHMESEDIKKSIEKTVETLQKLPLGEVLKAYGFALGLQANETVV